MKKFLPARHRYISNFMFKKSDAQALAGEPKSFKNPRGFTLVELLIVVAILAILATIGFAILGNQSGKARDARRKADLDQISKAYEVTYDQNAGEYRALTGADFTSGTVPTDPVSANGNYACITGPGPECTDISATTFTVCAALEGGTVEACSVAGAPSVATCYCKSAAQSPLVTPPPPPAN